MARALIGRRPVCPAADYDFGKNFLLQSFLLYNKIFSSVLFTFLFIQARDYRGGGGGGGGFCLFGGETRRGEGEGGRSPLPFLKNWKKVP